jgi:putative ABC transport system ATP-binding protein
MNGDGSNRRSFIFLGIPSLCQWLFVSVCGPSRLSGIGGRGGYDAEMQDSGLPIVRLEGVRKAYGGFEALRALTLTIPRGRMVALLGRSGSGKSTLLNLLGAVDTPTSGTVVVDGQDLSGMTAGGLALFRRRRLGFVFQSFHLLPSLTVFDNVAVPWTLDRALTKQRRQEISALLERLELGGKGEAYPDQLSGGQQQRVAIARAVVHRPALLLADEPTGNLDVKTGRTILELLTELHEEMGLSILMATHAPEAAERCQDQLHLVDGAVAEVRGEIVVGGQ